MGRPKLSDLSCSICQLTFKRKSLFEKHMEEHSSCNKKSRNPRVRSNWCHACRKSFEDNDYKLHIQTEHKFDIPKASEKDLFSYESGYVLLSKKRIKQERESPTPMETTPVNNFSFDVSDIKIEPDEIPDYEEFISPMTLKKNILKVKIPTKLKVECKLCGLRCKSERGLKIHMSAHRRIRKISVDSPSSEDETYYDKKQDNEIPKQEAKSTKTSLDGDSNQLLHSNNNHFIVQNTQPGFVFNVSPFLNQPLNNTLNFGMCPGNTFNIASSSSSVANNQSSVILNVNNNLNPQISSDVLNENTESPKGVLKFDCNSEKYMKWLKKFVYKCKMSKYPLDRTLLKKICEVTDEIINALAYPTGSLRKKSTHFYFMRMNSILLDVVLGHMQDSLSDDKDEY